MSYELTIEPLGQTIEVEDGQTILDAALRAGIYLPHACCHGLCATCKVQVVDGEVEHGEASAFALMDFEREEQKCLACCATLQSDVTIEADIDEDPDARVIPVVDYQGTVSRIENLTPTIKGVWIKIDDDRKVRSRDLIGYMTNESTAQVKRKYGVGEEIVVTQSEYDLRTRELPYIVYRLSFYDILGGADYTSLTNYELEHLDLSSFLDLDYAVFIAEMDVKDLIPVTADNQQVPCAETTILRVIIPVGRPGSKSASGRNAGNKNSFAPNVEPRYPLPVNSKPVLPQPQKQ
jgi:ferredoxin